MSNLKNIKIKNMKTGNNTYIKKKVLHKLSTSKKKL